MSNLLQRREVWKPITYPWAYDYYKLQNQMHWMPEEIPLAEDVRDWNNRLTDSEKNFITQILRFFTQGDVDVAAGYCEKFLPIFPQPELRMMMASFANMEGIHIEAYALLLDTLGLPESEYAAFKDYEAMAAKHDYVGKFNITGDKGSPEFIRELAKTIAVYSAFTEGLQLFSSFIMLLNFSRFGKLKGMAQIVTYSIRDESLHVEGMMQLFKTLIGENYTVWDDSFKKELYTISREMVALEDKFIDLSFEMGPMEGLEPDEVKQYVRYIADRRLLQLGLKPNFKVKDNPLPWVDELLNGVEHMNFFEGRATEYTKAATTGEWGF